ncbi:MAG: ankyrin repeat domain-containing protein [Gemmatimonadales bacterium]|nr:ankyrin repeat domain-containing protein [Gemmatimonadales bacterium]
MNRNACWAAHQGAAWKVTALLAEGVNPNGNDARGRTPLMFAAAGGHTECVRLLITAGADPMRRATYGHAPRRTALEIAIEYGRLECVGALLDAGVPINGTWRVGRSALETAVRFGREDILRCLLARGADPNQRAFGLWGLRAFRLTPLHWAVSFRRELMIADLIAHGANPLATVMTVAGPVSPIRMARRRRHTSIVEILQRGLPRRV